MKLLRNDLHSNAVLQLRAVDREFGDQLELFGRPNQEIVARLAVPTNFDVDLREQAEDEAAARFTSAFWDKLENEGEVPLIEIARKQIRVAIIGFYMSTSDRMNETRRRLKSIEKSRRYTANLLRRAAARIQSGEADALYYLQWDDDFDSEQASEDLVPRMLSCADRLEHRPSISHPTKNPKGAGNRRRTQDRQLLLALIQAYHSAGGNVSSTPDGRFARFLKAVWHVLPPQPRRCISEERFVSQLEDVLPGWKDLDSGNQTLISLE